MQQVFQIQVSPEIAQNPEKLKRFVAKNKRLHFNEIKHLETIKRSIDARQKNVKVNLRVAIFLNEEFNENPIEIPFYKDVSNFKEVIVIGGGDSMDPETPGCLL